MDFRFLIITTSNYSLRELIYPAKVLHLLVILACIFFGLPTSEQSSVDGLQKCMETDDSRFYRDNIGCASQDTIFGNSKLETDNTATSQLNYAGVCTNSHSFCFPSTLSGFSSKVIKTDSNASWSQFEGASPVESTHDGRLGSSKSWLSDHGVFELFEGEIISCSLNSVEGVDELSSILKTYSSYVDLSICREPFHHQKTSNFLLEKDSDLSELSSSYSSLSPHVNINPTLLDWGQNPLYTPSLASLTVENMCTDSVLHIYEPFSTDSQFYPCNASEALLGPGEITSICFVFLPRWLGLSSGHLILQTNFGGFLVKTKGFAIQSPYGIQPLTGEDISVGGMWIKKLSLFNPFDEYLYIEKIAAWISFSQEDAFSHIEATCSVKKFKSADEVCLPSWKDWLLVESSQMGRSVLSVRPDMHWKIGPRSNENIIEIEFSVKPEENISSGAVCIRLLRSSQNKYDTILVPFEFKIEEKMVFNECERCLSVFLEPLLQYENVSVAVSLKNNAPHVLSVLKIFKITNGWVFPTRYFEGLLLFPGTTTQVAMICCNDLNIQLDDSSPELADMYKDCKLLFVANDSSSSHLEVHCQDVVKLCSRYWKDSFVNYERNSLHFPFVGLKTRFLGSYMQLSSQIKVRDGVEFDELVLGNWKSQGTTSSMSVLDEQEVSFTVVEVGSYCSRWITLKNPSEKPVTMQLILNSLEIIDECDDLDQPPPDEFVHNGSFVPRKYGFSLEESALTEAFVHPHSTVSLGRIFFYPSNRCGWKSSALIRNNLSGVEWLSLRGFGGSLSLSLLDGSQNVKSIEFNLDLSTQLNISFSEVLVRMEMITHICSQPLLKELYAKNVGDIPLKVLRIEIAGTECESDGFSVQDCKAFALEPGESKKLVISYQTDFSTVAVHRDIELILDTRMLAVPMKVSIPLDTLNKCRKSVFWVQLKKFSLASLVLASLIFALICSWLGSNEKGGSNGIEETLFPVSDSNHDIQKQGSATQHEKQTTRPAENNHVGLNGEKEKSLQSSLSSKSRVIENSDNVEGHLTNSLTIRTEKERGRRRRKRKGSGGKLLSLLEVSSSQSGNSTPSSPLSPVSSGTPKRTWPLSPNVDQTEIRNPFVDVEMKCQKAQYCANASKADELNPDIPGKSCVNNDNFSTKFQFSESRKSALKPVLLPSATFPSAGKTAPNMWLSSGLVSTSRIALHARAPGPKLLAHKPAELEEKERPDEYTYDIWGDHLSGLHLISRSNDGISSMISSSARNVVSDSFFVRGPPTNVPKNQHITVGDDSEVQSTLIFSAQTLKPAGDTLERSEVSLIPPPTLAIKADSPSKVVVIH